MGTWMIKTVPDFGFGSDLSTLRQSYSEPHFLIYTMG